MLKSVFLSLAILIVLINTSYQTSPEIEYVSCPGNQVQCKKTQSCCLLDDNTYGCCPFVNVQYYLCFLFKIKEVKHNYQFIYFYRAHAVTTKFTAVRRTMHATLKKASVTFSAATVKSFLLTGRRKFRETYLTMCARTVRARAHKKLHAAS